MNVYKLILLFTCTLTITHLTKAQTHWESLVLDTNVFNYLVPNSNPAENWNQLNFDDSNWNTDNGGFGYGDNDDNTILETPFASLYLRKTINLPANTPVSQLILDIDYDDAFVAYINGQEVARSENLAPGTPSFDSFATSDHEAQMYSGGIPERHTLNAASLTEGDNILAIQVLNVSITSSDFSARIFLSAELDSDQILFQNTPDWFTKPFKFVSSNLPIIKINTNGQTIVDEPKTTSNMQVINNANGLNKIDDTNFEYDGYIGIEIRGNSTSGMPKKPFLFETRDNTGENLNVSLLGLPAENDWILRASYLDHTFIRNGLANYMARQTGYWASRTKLIELVINDEYQGIYVFMEKIKRDDNRLDIAKLNPDDLEGDEITGGYIWEITGFDTDFGENRRLKYPDIDEIHPDQLNYIRSFDDAFRDKMNKSRNTYSDPNTGYVEHIWTESFIYEVIIQEAMRNSDAYGWSGYFHKDKNELINAGPVWDFDQSSGNSSYPDDGVFTGWMIDHPNTNNTPFFWPALFYEPFFKYSLSLRWKELRADKFSDDNLFHYVDSIAAFLNKAQEREFEKWHELGENYWRETSGYQERDTYQKEVDYLKEFLTQRWRWIDQQLSNISKPSGYPTIEINKNALKLTGHILDKNTYVNLKNIFKYPYTSDLKYKAFSSDENIVVTDVTKSDSLKLKLVNIGVCDIKLVTTDTYGNKKDTTFSFEVLDGYSSIFETKSFTDAMISIYPNPAYNSFTIQTYNANIDIKKATIFNISGQKIESIYNTESSKIITYKCNHLENGIYILKITASDNRIISKKLIIK